LAQNNIIYTGNISGVSSTAVRKDRVGYDLFVPNDLSVAGDISVSGNLTVGGNILFSSSKKVSKTYWLYNYQIVSVLLHHIPSPFLTP
jgi:hypothetical protein